MDLEIERIDGGLRIAGEIDVATSPDLGRALREVVAAGGSVRLDVSGVSFMDSSGLQTLLDVVSTMNGAGPLILAHPTRAIRRLLDLTLPQGAPGLEVRE